ncbi:MAG: enoyl-ACP reductase [Candidatus Hydrogenedentota bacterium]|nr:MAG: enoyl-ACP reductase [Candidatus Hydrogenedentota bacterium]
MKEEAAKTRRAVVTGVANKFSIAWGIARSLAARDYELCLTYPDERLQPRVEELAGSLSNTFVLPLNVAEDSSIEGFAEELSKRWDGLDCLVHSIAYAKREELGGEFIDTSRDGFRIALDISAYSLIALTRACLPLLENRRGVVLTMSYLGGTRVIPNYNIMGVAKAALEMAARYLARDLGEKGVRVNIISPGPIKTAAARGISGFTEIHRLFVEKTPLHRAITIEDVGEAAAYLASDAARGITGTVLFIDGGHHFLGV